MKIKSKTCYFCLFFGIGYVLFVILLIFTASESDDWKVQFVPFLDFWGGIFLF